MKIILRLLNIFSYLSDQNSAVSRFVFQVIQQQRDERMARDFQQSNQGTANMKKTLTAADYLFCFGPFQESTAEIFIFFVAKFRGCRK